MDLQQHIEKESIIYDLETIKGCFLGSFLPIRGGEYIDFIINKKQNDLYKLVKYLEINKDRFFIGFNNISFDGQVLEYILDNYEKWYDLKGEEIAAKISEFGSKVIEDGNYGLFPPYREERMRIKQIDAPRIFHWFNENRRVSLKQAEFELRAETIENFEFDPQKEDFTDQEVQDLIFYCHNDVKYTKEVFLHVLGQTSHPLYKGRNKVADRVNFMKEIDIQCLNYDDVKIGAEWNKIDYCKLSGRDPKDLKPMKVNHFYGKKYSRFFPKTAEFQTDGLKKFIKDLGNTTILGEKQEFIYTFKEDLVVTVARGGLHSTEKARILRPGEDEIFLQNDVGSQYPKAIVKFKAFPKHLGPKWIDMIIDKIIRRLGFKKRYKETKDPIYNSLQETGKYSLNGGAYGKLGAPGDWQEDPCAMLTVTLGCQLEILMIVEALIMAGFNITSCNTDGWDCIIPKDRLNEYFALVAHYEKKIDADPGTIEYTVFKYMVQTSVNDYVAEKLGVYELKDGVMKFIPDAVVTKESKYPHLKLKGDFTVDFELHKNSSFRVLPLALVEYFDRNTDIEEFINNHTDIFDFCARSLTGKTYYHEGYHNSQAFKLPKLIRYYVAKDGIHIKKIVKEEIDTGANDQSVQPKDRKKKVCNRILKDSHQEHLENVDRTWYIEKVKETIFKIEYGKNPKKVKPVDPNQLKLF